MSFKQVFPFQPSLARALSLVCVHRFWSLFEILAQLTTQDALLSAYRPCSICDVNTMDHPCSSLYSHDLPHALSHLRLASFARTHTFNWTHTQKIELVYHEKKKTSLIFIPSEINDRYWELESFLFLNKDSSFYWGPLSTAPMTLPRLAHILHCDSDHTYASRHSP